MSEIPTGKDLEEYFYNASYYRGKLINDFCNLELAIERYLVRYFLDKTTERRELKNLILDRLTFEAKRTALKTMLDSYEEKRGFIKTKSNKYPQSDLLNEIRLLNDQRNYFAHYYLAIPVKEEKLVICLAEYRDFVKTHKYTEEKFNAIIERIQSATKQLYDLINERFPT